MPLKNEASLPISFEMGSDAHANLNFTEEMLRCPPVRDRDVKATREHFAISSYAVPPDRDRQYVDPQFGLDCFPGASGETFVWFSMVPFEHQDFRFTAAPWLRFRFGQTNYRTYVIDRSTNRRSVWFFGTTSDSWTVAIW